jgi:hypothetical protein
MRLVTGLTLALFSWLPGQAFASSEPPSETVNLLVRDPHGVHQLSADHTPSPAGWVRLAVPIVGTIGATVVDVAERLGAEVVVERSYRLLGPEDEPSFGNQWSLENTGQFGGKVDADIDATVAWAESLGSGVVVAVIDSGIDSSHTELDSRIWTNPGETVNGIDDDANTYVDDVVGWDTLDEDNDPRPVGPGEDEAHATMVAGIVAAEVNGFGITGVAPSAKLMNLRACELGSCLSLDVAEAIYYAVDEGADLINLSIGSPGLEDIPLEEAIEYARTRQVVVVAAAGNDGIDIDNLGGGQIMIPAGLPHTNIISVAASDDDDLRAGFSNYGSGSVDVFAPGEFIRTTASSGLPALVFVDGTSFSAPIVAGLAALLLSSDPGIGHQELIARIEGFADTPAGLSGLAKAGRVNAGTALTTRFTDTAGSIFVNAIDWLAEQGITEGCNPPQNHKYCPNNPVTRGEMAVFLARSFNLPPTGTDFFTDDNGKFYEGAANKLAAAGLTVGCGPGKYCGDSDIRRDEMAAMLARATGVPSTTTNHFVDDEGSIFENAINKIAEVGITKGCNPPVNDKYCPTDKVTRGQMAAFIKRALAVIV